MARHKTGGRGKGTPNKVTSDLREWIKNLLNNNKTQFENDLKALEPQQRIMVFEKLLNYAVPKMQSIEAAIDFNRLTDEQLDTVINELIKDFCNE